MIMIMITLVLKYQSAPESNVVYTLKVSSCSSSVSTIFATLASICSSAVMVSVGA